RLLQRTFYSLYDARQWILQCFENFVTAQGKATWHTLRQVTAANINFTDLTASKGTTNFLLDALGGCIADDAAIVATHIVNNRFIKTVTANADRIRINHAIQGNNRDFRGAATNIH